MRHGTLVTYLRTQALGPPGSQMHLIHELTPYTCSTNGCGGGCRRAQDADAAAVLVSGPPEGDVTQMACKGVECDAPLYISATMVPHAAAEELQVGRCLHEGGKGCELVQVQGVCTHACGYVCV